MVRKLAMALAVVALVATACGGEAGGSAGAGEALFAQTVIGSNPGCITCHSIDGSELIGPTMVGVATRAETRVAGQTAEEYLRESIVNPSAFVVQGYTGQMLPNWAEVLSEQELDDLVAYLLTFE